MGNSGSSSHPIRHSLKPGQTIDSSALAREWDEYLRLPGARAGNASLKKATAKRFVLDFASLFGIPEESMQSILLAMDLDERNVYSFDDFKKVFLLARAAGAQDQEIDISESLNQMQNEPMEAPPAEPPSVSAAKPKEERPKKKGIDPYQDMPFRDLEPCSSFTPAHPKRYTPPAQLMAREWSLIFSHPCLTNRDIDSANLACRFFRTVLFKHPPENWRVLALTSLERRTAENMTAFVQWQRLRSICRLEVGTFSFANMLKDDDLQVIFVSLNNLRSLKLYWCHLITPQVWATLRCDTLKSLNLKSTSIDLEAAAIAFPNLEELKLWACLGPSSHGPAERLNLTGLAKIAKLKKLWLSQQCTIVELSRWCTGLQLTHLWVARDSYYVHNNQNPDYSAPLRKCVVALKATLQKLIGPTIPENHRLVVLEGTNVVYLETRAVIAAKKMRAKEKTSSGQGFQNYQDEEIESIQTAWSEL